MTGGPNDQKIRMTRTFTPRLNHVAISVDPAVMDEKGRKDILDFYGEVFGWTEGDNSAREGNPSSSTPARSRNSSTCSQGTRSSPRRGSTTSAYRSPPAASSSLTSRELRITSRKTTGSESSTSRAVRHRDPTHDYTLTSAYIGYLLPLMIELQHLERSDRGVAVFAV